MEDRSGPYECNQHPHEPNCFVAWFDTGADTAEELRYQLSESIKASVIGDEPHEYEDALLALTDEQLLNAFRYSRGEESDGVQPIHSIRVRLTPY